MSPAEITCLLAKPCVATPMVCNALWWMLGKYLIVSIINIAGYTYIVCATCTCIVFCVKLHQLQESNSKSSTLWDMLKVWSPLQWESDNVSQTTTWLALRQLNLWMHTLQRCNRSFPQATQLRMFSYSRSGSFPQNANAGDFCSHKVGPDWQLNLESHGCLFPVCW